MNISKQLRGQTVELKIDGRLDGYWADHLATVVDQEIREGSHHILLDLSGVPFLSSAGIGVLVRFYKDLKNINGSFAVSNCSRTVLKVLELSKLDDILVLKPPLGSLKYELQHDSSVQASTAPKQIERSGAIYEVYPLNAEAKLECTRLGDPSLLQRCGFAKQHCLASQFSESSFAIGLGALGDDFEDCQKRFGEFIAVGGAVAYLPTDGTNVPDFLLSGGPAALPDVQVCYGIACHGVSDRPFSTLIRFDANKGAPVRLNALLESCLDLTDTPRAGIVMIVESAGLIGAALRSSPVPAASETDPFGFPRIRDWLSFTVERAYTRSIAVLAGVAVRGDTDILAPVVRPFANTPPVGLPLAGHMHAAVFSYRPLQKGLITFATSIKSLFERQTLEAVLHLINDDRAISGSGQSEFARGACWIAPISGISINGVSA